MEKELQDYLDSIVERLKTIEALLVEKAIKFRGDLTDVKGAARLTGLSVSRIYTLVNNRRIPFFKKDKHLYFSKPEIMRWIKPLERKNPKNKEIKDEDFPEQNEMD